MIYALTVPGPIDDVEEVIDQSGQVADLAVDDRPPLRARLGGHVRPVEDRDRGADGGERVAQLVRECREELVLAPVRLAQVLLGVPALGNVLDRRHQVARRARR